MSNTQSFYFILFSENKRSVFKCTVCGYHDFRICGPQGMKIS